MGEMMKVRNPIGVLNLCVISTYQAILSDDQLLGACRLRKTNKGKF